MRSWKIWALLVSGLLFWVALFVGIGYNRIRTLTGECPNVAQLRQVPEVSRVVEVVPHNARDIHYYARPYNAYFEFDFSLTEPEFLAWAREQGFDPDAVRRARGKHTLLLVDTPSATDVLQLMDSYCVEKEVTDGKASGPQAIVCAYDLVAGTAYLKVDAEHLRAARFRHFVPAPEFR
jgi:hypothetical protein